MNDARLDECVARARMAQRGWAARPTRERARRVGAVRHRLAAQAESVVAAVGDRFDRGAAETLTAEVIPLADAARWIARCAARVLAPRRFGRRGRPAWLVGVHGTVQRRPHGVIGVVAPGNYRLLLAGVQTLQALAAGNAVLVKPAPGAAAPMHWLREALVAVGVPGDLVQVLADDHDTGAALSRAAIDKLVLTGSAATGRAAAAELAARPAPAALELSGDDAVFVLESADVAVAAAAIVWGMGLNGGATCIAPRRVFVVRSLYDALARALTARLADRPPRDVAPAAHATAGRAVAAARADGWTLIGPAPDREAGSRMAPCLLASAETRRPALPGDLFAPVASLIAVDDIADALACDRAAAHALGAAIFGPPATARALADELDAGVVTVNDLIAPTADPRAPLTGARASGYGATRGAEGLIAMTRPQTVLTRRGALRPHLAPPAAGDAELFAAYLRLAHGRGLAARWAGLRDVIAAARARRSPAEGADQK